MRQSTKEIVIRQTVNRMLNNDLHEALNMTRGEAEVEFAADFRCRPPLRGRRGD
ncbi:hypothetical protein PAE9249_01579 [Paenibacillus sp. CECT 9249]|uniref:hypothetical protein n=1 Tax=Paenibacillus sp. CECT 9249 TaxID=2845385 RepID=UPI001E5EEA9A|nr:hypothetical protein [Paenibacillus sp. CECT 9249]CAH0119082.1 hypothetical protein PAE9249_01579 [Paenibacillus sp. CECT 9249]